MDPDFWEFEIPEPPRYLSYDELIQQEWEESPPLAILLFDAEDWCEALQGLFDNETEALAFAEAMLVDELKPYVRNLLPFYFLSGTSDDLP